ncbi:hypothetical protein B0I73DRAFT_127433 [Yarrowia lipolytica]|jgi:hypothetical protein|uniref:YALI0E29381p n=2 Tax=Yarrowia lipolytica TaxID=4952 RepID=Q6C463_YARLI|nr:YALI0E29381p [Yarrowia lipolytica CLIB122]AOW06130.1 hypothetical protein YALI1_E34745g [Yarrowia lipolytica]KAB8285596.1 hypothetical protein BKA91DRAFT_133322 [Yarrowia lipolytica]KAE8175316.1 hypothetical protein BKA90DRAFT_132448 [Yarrowia lipolytica]KAJ8057526.1 hypothetical protein LXG23DRAFT_34406 [Yarrowia lipolytica]QNP99854.1 Hypothetical protein YALI2_E01170g [Yarrowia lipolytica]|eukprot:XP_504549.1 YALI0E29381p [Yarrowia lipolytica CLIB122]
MHTTRGSTSLKPISVKETAKNIVDIVVDPDCAKDVYDLGDHVKGHILVEPNYRHIAFDQLRLFFTGTQWTIHRRAAQRQKATYVFVKEELRMDEECLDTANGEIVPALPPTDPGEFRIGQKYRYKFEFHIPGEISEALDNGIALTKRLPPSIGSNSMFEETQGEDIPGKVGGIQYEVRFQIMAEITMRFYLYIKVIPAYPAAVHSLNTKFFLEPQPSTFIAERKFGGGFLKKKPMTYVKMGINTTPSIVAGGAPTLYLVHVLSDKPQVLKKAWATVEGITYCSLSGMQFIPSDLLVKRYSDVQRIEEIIQRSMVDLKIDWNDSDSSDSDYPYCSAVLEIPVSASKTIIPSFYSALISRQYLVRFDLEFEVGTMSLTVPVEITKHNNRDYMAKLDKMKADTGRFVGDFVPAYSAQDPRGEITRTESLRSVILSPEKDLEKQIVEQQRYKTLVERSSISSTPASAKSSHVNLYSLNGHPGVQASPLSAPM